MFDRWVLNILILSINVPTNGGFPRCRLVVLFLSTNNSGQLVQTHQAKGSNAVRAAEKVWQPIYGAMAASPTASLPRDRDQLRTLRSY